MTAPPAPIAPTAAGPPVGRIIAVVLGALGLLVGLAASAVGAGLVWVDQTQLDALAKQIGREAGEINAAHMDALLWAQELADV